MKSYKLNKSVPELNERLYDELINYSWPGNIRQLENVIENIVNLDGNMSFVLKEEKTENKGDISRLENKIQVAEEESDEIYNLEYIEKRHIIKALRKYKNNICKTSDTLGISRNTLYSKIKKYQIDLS